MEVGRLKLPIFDLYLATTQAVAQGRDMEG